jgi:hypothetical protein
MLSLVRYVLNFDLNVRMVHWRTLKIICFVEKRLYRLIGLFKEAIVFILGGLLALAAVSH